MAGFTDDDELLTDQQFRDEYLDSAVGETTRRWRKDGYGPPYIRIGPSLTSPVRYRRSDIRKWLASRTFPHRAAEAVARQHVATDA